MPNAVDSGVERMRWGAKRSANWDSIVATDFFTVEVVTLRGLVTYYILFVIDLASRTVRIGTTAHPHEAWMVQMVRNLTKSVIIRGCSIAC